jgi:hypothetical protein
MVLNDEKKVEGSSCGQGTIPEFPGETEENHKL